MGDTAVSKEGCTLEEVVASHVYARFAKDGVSKAVAAQYLAERLSRKSEPTPIQWRQRLPKYITEAIDYVTGGEKGVLNRKEDLGG